MPEEGAPATIPEVLVLGLVTAATIILYYVNFFNYLLFHSSVEIFSAVIAFTVAVITLISWRRIGGATSCS